MNIECFCEKLPKCDAGNFKYYIQIVNNMDCSRPKAKVSAKNYAYQISKALKKYIYHCV